MIDRFTSFIAEKRLFELDEKILVAVSGGIDSVVLVNLMHTCKFDIALAHCNFQLRGNDSDDDEIFVKKLANHLKLEFYTKKFETKKYSKENGMSTQMAARNLRYDWFNELQNKYGFTKLATAHHASDQTETIIFNLSKGTGLPGLMGIPLVNGSVVRPLLFASRNAIEQYAKDTMLEWREDSSNSSLDYHRNLIRHQVIPELKKINPSLESTMQRNAKRFEALDLLIEGEIKKVTDAHLKVTKESVVLGMDWMTDYVHPEVILGKILKTYGFNSSQTEDIAQASNRHSGAQFLTDEFELRTDRKKLVITPIDSDLLVDRKITMDAKIVVEGNTKLDITQISSKDFNIPHHSHIGCLDYDKLTFPLNLRNWREGDRFFPLGMKSQKKLSDFMIDEKIPVNLKRKILVLESGKNIVWIVGFRIDDRYKITGETQRILMITKEES